MVRNSKNVTHPALRTPALEAGLASFTPSKPALAVAAALAFASPSWSNPTAGLVVSGQAAISAPTATSLVIDQASNKAIIHWNSFSIGANERVRFNQPSASSVALNRVLGNSGSEIFGALSANGQIFLLNPNGVLMGRGAQISAAGFLASSLGITDSDFLGGRYRFTRGTVARSVINEGSINTSGGYTALIAPHVENHGYISARLGSVVLAAGDRVTLDFTGDGLMRLGVDQAALTAAIRNSGTITADGGRVILSAKSANALLDTVLNNDGIIRADTLVDRHGVIALESSAGIVSTSGSLLARGLHAGERGGTVSVTAPHVLLTSTAVADASGMAGGGNIFIGGNWQGQGPLANAQRVIVAHGATLDASATQVGDGGTAVVWADNTTHMSGNIAARGGSEGGNGGKVETSGKQALDLHGTVDVSAPKGKGGSWLLDPNDITIFSGGSSNLASGAPTFQDDGGNAPAFVNNVTLGNAITGGATITVQTSNAGTPLTGSIIVNDSITAAGAGTLNFIASGNVTINQAINNNPGTTLNLGVYAGSNGTPASIATAGKQAGNVTTNTTNTGGGTLTVVTGTNGQYTVGGGAQTFGGDIAVDAGSILDLGNLLAATGNMSLKAHSGNISLTRITANQLTVQSSGGNFTATDPTNGVTTLGTVKLGTGALSFKNSAALGVTGVISASGGITLESDALTLNNNLNAGAGTVSLTTTGAGNAIFQAAGVITADTLALKTVNGAANVGASTNAITKLSTTALGSGGLTLIDAGGLTVTGTVGAGDVTLLTSGPLAINNAVTVSGSSFVLDTSSSGAGAGKITQNSSGNLTALNGNLFVITNDSNVTLNTATNNIGIINQINLGAGQFTYAGDTSSLRISPFVATTADSLTVTNNAAITLFAPLQADKDITIRSIGSKVESAQAPTITSANGNITIHGSNNVRLVDDGPATLSAANGNLTLISSTGVVNAVKYAVGKTFTVQIGPGNTLLAAAIATPDSSDGNNNNIVARNVVLVADKMDFAGIVKINTAAGTVAPIGSISLAPVTNITQVDLSSPTTNADANGLIINTAALDKMTSAAVLNIGRTGVNAIPPSTNTAGIINLGAATIANPALNLFSGKASGNAIIQDGVLSISGGAGTLGVTTAGGNAVLTQDNNIGTLGNVATGAGSFTLYDKLGGLNVTGPVTAAAIDLRTEGGNLAINGGMTASGGTITLTNPSDSVTQTVALTTKTLTVSTLSGNGSITLGASNDITGIASLSTNKDAKLVDANSLAVTLNVGGKADLTSSGSLSLAGSANELTATSNGGTVNQTGALTVTDTLTLSTAGGNATLDGFTNAVTKLGASALGTGELKLLDAGGLTVTGAVAATGGITLNTSGALALNNTLDTSASAMSLTTTGGGASTITQGAAGKIVANSVAINASGDVSLDAATNAFNAIGVTAGAITLRDSPALNVTALTNGLNQAVDIQTGGALTLPAAAIDTGTATLILASTAASVTTSGTLAGSVSTISGATGITLGGNVTTSGDQRYTGAVTLNAPVVTLTGATPAFSAGVVGAGKDLTLSFTGTTVIEGASFTGIRNLTSNNGGATNLTGAITTTGTQTYTDAVVLTGNTTTAAGANLVSLGSTVNATSAGTQALTVSGAGGASFASAVGGTTPLASVAVTGATTLGGNVTTTGGQTYSGAVTLGANTVITGVGNTFAGPINGAKTLTVNDSGSTTFGGIIGGTAALTSLTSDAAGSTTLSGGAITTTGPITLNDAVSGNNLSLDAGAGAITAINAGNDFTGTTKLTGGTIEIVDKNQTTVILSSSGFSKVTGNLDVSGVVGTDLTLTTIPDATIVFVGDTTVGGNLTATAGDSVTQGAGTTLTVAGTSRIDAGKNASAITLTNATNDFGGIATFIGGTVQVTDLTALTAVLSTTGVATLNAATALTVSGAAQGVIANAGTTMTVAAAGLNGGAGAVQLLSPGNLTLDGAVSSTAAGNAVTLVTTAGNFTNNAGAAAVSAPAGRLLIYSGSPLLDSKGGLSAPNTRYGAPFDPAFANIPFAGSGFLYRIQPTLTITADAAARVVGAANPAFTFTPTGFIAGDTAAAALAGAPALTTPATPASVAGAYPIIAAAGTLTSPMNYSLTYAPGTLTVVQINVTVTANNQLKFEGASDPLFTFTATAPPPGFITTGALTRAPGETAGNYNISIGSLASAGLVLDYVAGALTIVPNPIVGIAAAATATTTGIPLFTTDSRQMMCLVGDVELLYYPLGEPIRIPK